MWFIGVEVDQETSAPPPKKNPGSAPDVIARSRVFRFSNTLGTTRNEADNIWCSLLKYFFLFFGQVHTSKGNRYHV